MDLLCIVCRELFDDPVLARDGFAYCRACIVRWVDGAQCWTSPRTNERFEGAPVLRGDVERTCRAREARLAELRSKDPEEAARLAAEAVWLGRPLAPPRDCARLLDGAASPYLKLELALRAGRLPQLDAEVLQELCRLDRAWSRAPLLEMGALAALLHEARRRVEAFEEPARLLLELRDHFSWRASFCDAVEVPECRTSHAAARGLYYRAWTQRDLRCVVFLKPGARLTVPLRSNRARGVAEPQLLTQLELTPPGGPAALVGCFSSEDREQLPVDPVRAWRGAPPFPDSSGDSDEEEGPVPACASVFQRPLAHLPLHFLYHARREDGPREAALAEKSAADDALIELAYDRAASKRLRYS